MHALSMREPLIEGCQTRMKCMGEGSPPASSGEVMNTVGD